MTDTPLTEAEEILRELSAQLTEPVGSECLLCFVYRMLEHGCRGLRWARRYRDLRAPQASALVRRLRQVGAGCDCEIFWNGYVLHDEHLVRTITLDQDGDTHRGDLEYPEVMPPCQGARAGSTRPCALWLRRGRHR